MTPRFGAYLLSFGWMELPFTVMVKPGRESRSGAENQEFVLFRHVKFEMLL